MRKKNTDRRGVRQVPLTEIIVFLAPCLITFLFLITAVSHAGPPSGARLGFSDQLDKNGNPQGWGQLIFRGVRRHTEYRLIDEDGSAVVNALSQRSASALLKRLNADLKATPVLRWRWKISGTLTGGDASSKEGDDLAARVYVMFRYDPARAGFLKKVEYEAARLLYGEYPPDSALNYIWANRLERGKSIPNAFADNAIMIALRSGDKEAGRWVSERVNIFDDYRKYFGADPPPVEGIAIMTDSDNTGGQAEAWYADISLSAE